MAAAPTIDQAKLEAFMGQFVQDMGAAATAPLVVIGDKLGLYKAMADGTPVTPARARRAHRLPRALCARVALPAGRERATSNTTRRRVPAPPGAGARAGRSRTARCSSPAPSSCVAAMVKDEPHITRALPLRRGHAAGASTTTTCSRAPSASSAPAIWRTWWTHGCPSLDGVVEKLRAGARVADIGCGHGASTILMAKAFPASTVHRLGLPRRLDRGGADRPPSAPA